MADHHTHDEHIHGVLKGSNRTEEEEEGEEDLANCLILLAQGQALDTTTTSGDGDGEDEKFAGEKPTGAANPPDNVYRCRTCNKCFYSFQALGGHRTSHKRPKTSPSAAAATTTMATTSLASCPDNRSTSGCATQMAATVSTAGGKSRSHECLICGLDFSSGQALGGHMRRHRPTLPPASSKEAKKEKSAFDLDLNRPAPADDDPKSSSTAAAFPSAGKRQPLYLLALLDCHY